MRAFHVCALCEATCGLELSIDDGVITRVRGDRDHVFSQGFICPKGSVVHKVHEDPDRLRTPLIRREGVLVPADWQQAFEEVDRRLTPIIEEHGRDAVAMYIGNPAVHSPAGQLYVKPLAKALGTKNIFSASTVDQMPKHVAAGLMFGHPLSIPVPDIDRTDYLLILGANPKVSNGSLATAPNWPGRMRAITQRGGKVVVVDPRRTETAKMADEHLFIRPSSDAAWLAALVAEVLAAGGKPIDRLAPHISDVEPLPGLLAGFTPESVAPVTGIDPAVTKRVAREFADAPRAVAYGRIGTQASSFGTLASWLVDVLNLVTGNLDQPGGAMFPRGVAERPRHRAFHMGRWTGRTSQRPEVMGELPVATLADEILTPGPGQVKALITIAGNPLRSVPDTSRLAEACDSLDLLVSVDPFLGATGCRADVVLPPPSSLQRSHFDIVFSGLSVRNVACYSPPVLPLTPTDMPEWEILTRLALIASGHGSDVDVAAADNKMLAGLVAAEATRSGSSVSGRDPAEIMDMLGSEPGPDRVIDFVTRTGPYGDGFRTDPDGLNLGALRAHPHGIDFGPLRPRLPGLLCTDSGTIEAAPSAITDDLPRLRSRLESEGERFVLIGRRGLRTNNSWMHNVSALAAGRDKCTLMINPADAASAGLAPDGTARIATTVGEVTVRVEITDDMMPGVVSLPHGWGYDDPDIALSVAKQRPGVDVNSIVTADLEPVSGNAILNGVSVELVAV